MRYRKILARAEVEGYEILDRREVMSGDVTLVPKSLLEAQITLQKQENDFNKLPLDVRKNSISASQNILQKPVIT